MKRKHFIPIVLLFFCFIVSKASAQSSSSNPKIYFLVDTIGMPKESRFIKIGLLTPVEYQFTFYCKCIPPYDKYVDFTYRFGKNVPKEPVTDIKPNFKYSSWKSLLEKISFSGKDFSKDYDLYITEVLPNRKYRTNKVQLVVYPPPLTHGVVIKDKN
ncbi:hypothetical protein [Pedobacter sp. UC225_65]|uniref:hypothetical protein n=1 Tax=Pedobacter sp. UC225_65 TaxID=3350173 RepID=UPI00366D6B58